MPAGKLMAQIRARIEPACSVKYLSWQTTPWGDIEPQGLSGAVANRRPRDPPSRPRPCPHLRPRMVAIENLEINPMGHRSVLRGVTHSQCGAKTRAGTACQSPPVAGGKRCRLHGGLSPGAPRGSRNGNYRRGDWTTEAIEERRWLRSLVQAFAKTGTGR
jgi:hypothetical protein